jgi:hypothetical protein
MAEIGKELRAEGVVINADEWIKSQHENEE